VAVMLDGVVSRFICLFDAAAAYGGYATPLDAPVARAGLRSAADARSLNPKYRIARTIDVQSALGLHSLRAQRVHTITMTRCGLQRERGAAPGFSKG